MPPFPESTSKSKCLKPSATSTATPTTGITTTSDVTVTTNAPSATTPAIASTTGATGTTVTSAATVTATSTPIIPCTTGTAITSAATVTATSTPMHTTSIAIPRTLSSGPSSPPIRSTAMSEALRTVILNLMEAKLRTTATPSKPVKISAEVAKKTTLVPRTNEKRPREDITLEKSPRPGKCLRPANITEQDIVRFFDEKVKLATEEYCSIVQPKRPNGSMEVYFLIRRTASCFAHVQSLGTLKTHGLGPGITGVIFLCMKMMTRHWDLIRGTLNEVRTYSREARFGLLKNMCARLLQQEMLPGGKHVGDSANALNRVFLTKNSTVRVMYFAFLIFLKCKDFPAILHTLRNDRNHAIFTQFWYEEYHSEMSYLYASD